MERVVYHPILNAFFAICDLLNVYLAVEDSTISCFLMQGNNGCSFPFSPI